MAAPAPPPPPPPNGGWGQTWTSITQPSAATAPRTATRAYARAVAPGYRQRPTAGGTLDDRAEGALAKVVQKAGTAAGRRAGRHFTGPTRHARTRRVREAARDIDFGTFSEIVAGPGNADVQAFLAANHGVQVGAAGFNVHGYEFGFNDLAEAYGRRDAQGNLIQNGGRYLLLFNEWLSTVVAPMARAVLGVRGWTTYCWWMVQVFGGNGDVLASTGMQMGSPTVAEVRTRLQLLQNGPTSGEASEEMFNPGAFVRVSIGNPGLGYAGGSELPAHLRSHLGSRKQLWSPPLDDKLCGVWSFAVGYLHTIGNKVAAQNLKQRPKDPASLRRIKEYTDRVGDCGTTFTDLERLAEWRGVTVVVLDSVTLAPKWSSNPHGVPDEGGDVSEEKIVALIHDVLTKHYMFAGAIDAVHRESVFCRHCRKFVSRKHHRCGKFDCRTCGHRCKTKIDLWAHRYGRDGENKEQVKCAKCNQSSSAECIEAHTAKCKGNRWRCDACGESIVTDPKNVRYQSIEEHLAERCGKKCRWCENCKDHCPPGHSCRILPLGEEAAYKFNPKHPTFDYAFDIESAVNPENGLQIPVLVAVYPIIGLKKSELMDDFKRRAKLFYETEAAPVIFDGDKCMRLFATWLITRKHKVRILAHNAKGYDGPLLEYTLRELGVEVTAIKAGNKTIRLAWGPNGRSGVMTCSMSLFPSSLDKFAKAMLGQEVGKDRFPHSKHTVSGEEFASLNGEFPPAEWYLRHGLGREPDAAVQNWHDEAKLEWAPHTEKKWDYWQVLVEYCKKDTLLLAHALAVYRKAMFDVTSKDDGDGPGLDVLSCATVATAGRKAFRYCFMDHLPEGGLVTPTAEEDAFMRDASFGGNTQQFSSGVDLHTVPQYATRVDPTTGKTKKVRKVLKSLDFTSHYPWQQLNKKNKYPWGVPVWSDELDLDWTGAAKVTVRPPDDPNPHAVPVLPVKNKETGRLEFSYHRITGTYMISELKYAVENGYTIEKVHKVLHYPDARTEVFAPYMRKFFAGKMHASKPPKGEIPPIIRRFKEEYGIELDAEKLMAGEDPVLRALYKLFLNSLWGKFGQTEKPTTETVDMAQFHKCVQRHGDGKIRIVDAHPCPVLFDRFIITYYDLENDAAKNHNNTHVGISNEVLANGRRILHMAMDIVANDPDCELLYCDTDSTFFVAPEDWVHPMEGDGIGELLPEFKTYATRCAIVGPKTYYFDNPEDPEGNTKRALKGVPINEYNERFINYDAFMEVILNTDLRLYFRSFEIRRRGAGVLYATEARKVVGRNPEFAKRQPAPYGEHMPPWREDNEHLRVEPVKRTWSARGNADDDDDDDPLPPPLPPPPLPKRRAIVKPTAAELLEVAAATATGSVDADDDGVDMDEDDLIELHAEIDRERSARNETPLARAVRSLHE